MRDERGGGLSASPTQARDATTHFAATTLSDAATSISRTQFQACLCVNHLSAAAISMDPRVIQAFQSKLTIAAARNAVVTALTPSQQKNQAAVAAALAAHVKALWTADSVHVFLPGFTRVA